MPADKGVRLDDRQRIANFREQPIETNEYHSVDGAEREFLWGSSPQNVDLLPQRPNLCLKHYPRPDQIDNHPTNEPAKIPHCARSSSDSRSTAKQDKVCDRDSFQKGRSGNPKGRPKGSRNAATLACEALLDGQAEALTQKAIQMALDGDPVALRLCPPRRDRPVSFPLPPITGAQGCC